LGPAQGTPKAAREIQRAVTGPCNTAGRFKTVQGQLPEGEYTKTYRTVTAMTCKTYRTVQRGHPRE